MKMFLAISALLGLMGSSAFADSYNGVWQVVTNASNGGKKYSCAGTPITITVSEGNVIGANIGMYNGGATVTGKIEPANGTFVTTTGPFAAQLVGVFKNGQVHLDLETNVCPPRHADGERTGGITRADVSSNK